MAINRTSLREQIREELLRRVREGVINGGDEINEARLAAELGVSRTPLREALIALEAEGSISSDVGRGFRFALTTREEFSELAPVVAALECLALELTPADAWPDLSHRLLVLAEEFPDSVADHQELIRRDEEWHGLLTSGCTNQRLQSLLVSLKAALHLYEFEIVPSNALVERVAGEHLAIAERLGAGDLAGAQAALKANWLGGAQRIVSRPSAS